MKVLRIFKKLTYYQEKAANMLGTGYGIYLCKKFHMQENIIFPFSNFLIQVTNLAVLEEVTNLLAIAAHMVFKSLHYNFTSKINYYPYKCIINRQNIMQICVKCTCLGSTVFMMDQTCKIQYSSHTLGKTPQNLQQLVLCSCWMLLTHNHLPLDSKCQDLLAQDFCSIYSK